MVTSIKHEIVLKEYTSELRDLGYKVLDLERKCPDAIALKDGKIFAVEILGKKKTKKKGYKKSWTYKAKKSIYHMFDDLLIKEFYYNESEKNG